MFVLPSNSPECNVHLLDRVYHVRYVPERNSSITLSRLLLRLSRIMVVIVVIVSHRAANLRSFAYGLVLFACLEAGAGRSS